MKHISRVAVLEHIDQVIVESSERQMRANDRRRYITALEEARVVEVLEHLKQHIMAIEPAACESCVVEVVDEIAEPEVIIATSEPLKHLDDLIDQESHARHSLEQQLRWVLTAAQRKIDEPRASPDPPPAKSHAAPRLEVESEIKMKSQK